MQSLALKGYGVFGKQQKSEAKVILDGSMAAWRVERVETDLKTEKPARRLSHQLDKSL